MSQFRGGTSGQAHHPNFPAPGGGHGPHCDDYLKRLVVRPPTQTNTFGTIGVQNARVHPILAGAPGHAPGHHHTAHELTHVIQQRGVSKMGAKSLLERESPKSPVDRQVLRSVLPHPPKPGLKIPHSLHMPGGESVDAMGVRG